MHVEGLSVTMIGAGIFCTCFCSCIPLSFPYVSHQTHTSNKFIWFATRREMLHNCVCSLITSLEVQFGIHQIYESYNNFRNGGSYCKNFNFKPGLCGNWIEIAYGTRSGSVRVIVQHPETVGHSPQLFQTFTVHQSPVTKVKLSELFLISVCSEYNHVRTWRVPRFRGMISTQPGSTPEASFKVHSTPNSNKSYLFRQQLRINCKPFLDVFSPLDCFIGVH